jgi:N-acyl homoserine lactone hydrolase
MEVVMRKTPFIFKSSPAKTWKEVFSKPGPVSIKSFVTGESIIKTKGALNLEHPDALAIEDSSQRVPVLSHWIHHREFGDYLIDAGLDRSYMESSRGRFRGLLVAIFLGKGIQQKGSDITSRIVEENIDLKGIFFTHLHFDHVAGVMDIPSRSSIQYVAGKEENYSVINKGFLFRSPDFLANVETLYEIDFSNADDMPVLGSCVDIFGDGSLWAVSTPGHTPGHMSFLVNGESKTVFITGDACLLKEGFELGIGPGTFSGNIVDAQTSLDRLIEFSRKYPSVQMIFGHQLPQE